MPVTGGGNLLTNRNLIGSSVAAFLTEAFCSLLIDICYIQQHAAARAAELLRVRRGVHLHHLRAAGHSLRGLVQSR